MSPYFLRNCGPATLASLYHLCLHHAGVAIQDLIGLIGRHSWALRQAARRYKRTRFQPARHLGEDGRFVAAEGSGTGARCRENTDTVAVLDSCFDETRRRDFGVRQIARACIDVVEEQANRSPVYRIFAG